MLAIQESITHPVLSRWLEPPIAYNYHANPDSVQSYDDARRIGINCISLAHRVLEDLTETRLPDSLRFYESFQDRTMFKDVASLGRLAVGDLVWLGRANPKIAPEDFEPIYEKGELLNCRQFAVKHVAIATGDFATADDPMLLHASQEAGHTVLQSFSSLSRKDHGKIHRISRLKTM